MEKTDTNGLNEYQHLCMRTSPDGHDRKLNGCMGLIGESGEIVDVVKKYWFQSGDDAEVPKDHLIEEAGDVMWYVSECMEGIGKKAGEEYENDMETHPEEHKKIRKMVDNDILISACQISSMCHRPFMWLLDSSCDLTDAPCSIREAECARELCNIITALSEFLKAYCGSTLMEATRRNIEKLKKRYPDGFDPERSLHREE